jgi:dolichyl-phosphate-mannose-protein mannosyltransferase
MTGRGWRRPAQLNPLRRRTWRTIRPVDDSRVVGPASDHAVDRIAATSGRRPGVWYWLALTALLGLAAAIRIRFNDITDFNPGDESIYLRFTRMLASGAGYPHLVRMYIEDQTLWISPSPLRWAYLETATLACRATGVCTYRTLATLSTAASIVAVALTYWLGVRLFDRRTALTATALMATAPLQLALGRRALADELFCTAVLLSVVTMVEWLRSRRPGWLIGWIAATTIVFGVKEQFLITYPVVLAAWWARERKVRWMWVLPPVLFFVGFCALAQDTGSFFRVAGMFMSQTGTPYIAQLQSGAPQRVLIDFMAIAPIVTVAFIGAACSIKPGAARTAGQLSTVLVGGGILVVHSLIPSKNLRFLVAADPFMRLLVASWLPSTRWTIAALVFNGVVELVIFQYVFVYWGVYDPTTNELLRALRMLPDW